MIPLACAGPTRISRRIGVVEMVEVEHVSTSSFGTGNQQRLGLPELIF